MFSRKSKTFDLEAWVMPLQWSLWSVRSRFGAFVSAGKISFPGNGDFGSKSVPSEGRSLEFFLQLVRSLEYGKTRLG